MSSNSVGVLSRQRALRSCECKSLERLFAPGHCNNKEQTKTASEVQPRPCKKKLAHCMTTRSLQHPAEEVAQDGNNVVGSRGEAKPMVIGIERSDLAVLALSV